MAAEDTKGKKRKGAPESAPKAKKARKSDDIVVPKPAKAAKTASTEAKPVNARATRKTAADFISEDGAPAAEVAKPLKGKKKGKATIVVNGDASEPMEIAVEAPEVKEKPKKQSKKGKVAAVEGTLVVEAPVIVEAPVVVEAPKVKASKAKKSKKAEPAPAPAPAPVEEVAIAEAQNEAPAKKSKKVKGSKKQAELVEEVTEAEVVSEDVDGEAEDDQTAALLAGFESDDDDDKDPEDDNDFNADAPTPNLSKKDKTALEKALKSSKSNEPGVIYIGRVPRGFYEAEMKKYFSQFGRVNRLRLSRNKKTGASKHYAFVEFASSEVADIVARTMNNYLLFGHILRVNLIPAEQVHPELFKGAGERFKVDPRNKKAGLQMERGVDRAQWEKRVEKENKRRKGRSKALLEEYGYEYDAPAVKGVDSVAKQLENGVAQMQLDAPVQEASVEAPAEEPKAKKGKKAKAIAEVQPTETAQPVPGKKGKKAVKSKVDVEADVQAEIAAEVAAPTPEKKTTKDKKRKSDAAVLETTTTTTTTTVVEAPIADLTPRSKRAKREAKVVEEEVVVEKVTKPKKAKKVKA